MDRYMVTGAASQVGQELLKQLGEQILPRTRENLDVTNFGAVNDCIRAVKPEAIIHCAAYRGALTNRDDEDRCWLVNVLATNNIAKACVENGVPLIHLSTSRVFGKDRTRQTPYQELDAASPVGFYSQSKLAAEHAILNVAHAAPPSAWSKGFNYWILRTSYLFERPWRSYANLASGLCQIGSARGAVSAHSKTFMSVTYVPHFVQALAYLLNNRKRILSGVYHVANDGYASLFEFASLLARRSSSKFEVVDRRPNDDAPNNLMLDLTKFNISAGCPKLPAWEDALEEYCKELRRNT